jgi:hypothetical protein
MLGPPVPTHEVVGYAQEPGSGRCQAGVETAPASKGGGKGLGRQVIGQWRADAAGDETVDNDEIDLEAALRSRPTRQWAPAPAAIPWRSLGSLTLIDCHSGGNLLLAATKNPGQLRPGLYCLDSGQRIGGILPAGEGYRYIFIDFMCAGGGLYTKLHGDVMKDRSQFWKKISRHRSSRANREGSTVSQGARDDFWHPGILVNLAAAYDCVTAFCESYQTAGGYRCDHVDRPWR